MYAAISDDSEDNQEKNQYQQDGYIQKCSYVYIQENVSTN